MIYRKSLALSFLVLLALTLVGCARAARDTTGFALENSATVNASFEDTWTAVKSVLREQEFEIYTRDKRGIFEAYSPMKRRYLQPKRDKYTIALEPVSKEETAIRVETLGQVYGVTALTYPGWHDRKAKDKGVAEAIIAGVTAKVAS